MPECRLTEKDLLKFISELKRYKKKNSGWKAVNVETSLGEKIIVNI